MMEVETGIMGSEDGREPPRVGEGRETSEGRKGREAVSFLEP